MVTVLRAQGCDHRRTAFFGVTGRWGSSVESLYTMILIEKIAEQPGCMR